MKARVLPGFSVPHNGVWYNEGETFECPSGTSIKAKRPLLDAKGNIKGEEEAEAIELLHEPAKQKKEG